MSSSLNRNPVWGSALSFLIAFYFFCHPGFPVKSLYTWYISWFPTERHVFVFASWIVHFSIFVIGNLAMLFVYTVEHPFFEQYKIQKKPWPWHRSPEERAAYKQLVYKSIALIAFNSFVLTPVTMWHNYDVAKKFGFTADPEKIPAWYVSMFQITCFMVLEDTMFYWLHRFLHWGPIYGYIHKWHHQYKTTIGVASEYAHPIEFLLSNGIPFITGPILFGAHMCTWWQWTLLRIAETIDGHCGYEFPWNPFRLLPFSGSATAHDFHHSNNVGNFASFFTWWDQFCGTDQAFIKHEQKKAEKAAAGPNSHSNGHHAEAVATNGTSNGHEDNTKKEL